MLNQIKRLSLRLTIGVCTVCAMGQAAAQTVTVDGTTDTTVTDVGFFQIEGGDRPDNGQNLFHSFSEFSIPTGGAAFFRHSPDVETIFSRVTGSTASSIDGIIATEGSADLFLLNPNGILFGSNARLQLQGSFIGTAGTSVVFADGAEFSTVNATANSPLSISTPIGLQMGAAPGPVSTASESLDSAPGQTLALIGGDLSLQGETNFGYLFTSDGHIELGSVGGNSSVSLLKSTTPNNSVWTFSYDNVTEFRDITLDRTFVEAAGDGGGTIQLQGRTVEFINGAEAFTNTFGPISGGGITINASEALSIVGLDANESFSSGLFSTVRPDATGNGGDIEINAPTVKLEDGGGIFLQGFGDGNSGNLRIYADQTEIIGAEERFSGIFSFNGSPNGGTSEGNGGSVVLNGQNLSLTNGGRVFVYTFGDSNGGDLSINADHVSVVGDPNLADLPPTLISIFTAGSGDGGTAKITTESLNLMGGAQLFVSTEGSGDSGDLIIRAGDVLFDRAGYTGSTSTGIYAAVAPTGSGKAGRVDIETQQVALLNGAQIFGGNTGTGTGGEIKVLADTITAQDIGFIDEEVLGSGIISLVSSGAIGDTGDIELTTRQLSIVDGAEIKNDVLGLGQGGDITIQASDISIVGIDTQGFPSGIFSRVNPPTEAGQATVGVDQPEARGGNVSLNTSQLSLSDGAEIMVLGEGDGKGGNLSITANAISMVGRNNTVDDAADTIDVPLTLISVSTAGDRDAGTTQIATEELTMLGAAQIFTGTQGTGTGGDLAIQATNIYFDREDYTGPFSTGINTAIGVGGEADAGKAEIETQQLTLLNGAQIFGGNNGGSGNGGRLSVTADEIIATRSGIQLDFIH